MKQTCKHCKYFRRAIKRMTNQGETTYEKNYGYCSRHPQKLTKLLIRNYNRLYVGWKWVWEGDSCEDYEKGKWFKR